MSFFSPVPEALSFSSVVHVNTVGVPGQITRFNPSAAGGNITYTPPDPTQCPNAICGFLISGAATNAGNKVTVVVTNVYGFATLGGSARGVVFLFRSNGTKWALISASYANSSF